MSCRTCHTQSAAERLGDVPDSAVVVVDIAAEGAAEDLARAFDGAGALVIASSAVWIDNEAQRLFAQSRSESKLSGLSPVSGDRGQGSPARACILCIRGPACAGAEDETAAAAERAAGVLLRTDARAGVRLAGILANSLDILYAVALSIEGAFIHFGRLTGGGRRRRSMQQSRLAFRRCEASLAQ